MTGARESEHDPVPPQVQIGRYGTTVQVVLHGADVALVQDGRTLASTRLRPNDDTTVVLAMLANRVRREVETSHEQTMRAKGYR